MDNLSDYLVEFIGSKVENNSVFYEMQVIDPYGKTNIIRSRFSTY